MKNTGHGERGEQLEDIGTESTLSPQNVSFQLKLPIYVVSTFHTAGMLQSLLGKPEFVSPAFSGQCLKLPICGPIFCILVLALIRPLLFPHRPVMISLGG